MADATVPGPRTPNWKELETQAARLSSVQTRELVSGDSKRFEHFSEESAGLLKDYFPDLPTPLYAACIDRYRALGLWGPDPVIRREGYDRLHAAMRASGALSRDIAFEACVDTAMAEQAVRATPA